MPELPEVHTTVEGLKKVIIGKTIKEVWSDFHIGTSRGESQTIKNKKYFAEFKKIVTGAKIKSLARRGKNILINLEPSTNSDQANYTIVIHMKMTGCLMYKKDKNEKYLHLIFTFASGDYLLFSDLRKFASVTFIKSSGLNLHETVGKLGIDPFDPKLNAKKLFTLIHQKKSWPIKSALLDQATIAGIGNIYSDEILWQTGIHPLSQSDQIPEKKFGEILKVIRAILKLSIKQGGDSKSDYRNAFGGKGNFQNFHKVYGKKGQKCPKKNCSGIIERIVVKGRSAHFCPVHQLNFTNKI